MQCGYPGPGPVVVTFPAAERVPARIAASAVLVNGKAAPAASVSGARVRIALPAAPRIMCDEIGPGTLTVAFTRAANLGNPALRGSYRLAVSAKGGAAVFAVPFAISAA